MTTTDTTETVAAPPSGRNQVAPGTKVAPTLIGALIVLTGCIVALALGVVARHHAESEEFRGSTKIVARETSFRITISRDAVEPGRIGFDVHNDASIEHEFVVFKTDLPADQLRLGKDGDVIEDSPKLDNVLDSGGALAPNSRQSFFVHLDEGHYAVVCNLPGHYRNGMHVDLTVRETGS